jgi:acyl-CoA synthetase (AMP-forming)/AMP-acid ligase II
MGIATMLGALCAGVKMIHVDRFDAALVLERIEAEHPNVFVGVPTMYADLETAGAARRDLSSIELWVSAADAMPPDRARRFQQYGALGRPGGRRIGTAAFADVYGMVELGGPAAVRLYPPGPRRSELPALGFVLPGFSARVTGPDGRRLRMGLAGELQLRGPAVFAGYQGAAAPAEDGWFATGDLARLGPAGTFAFVGRNADRLKVGGFSVFPAEVEAELRGHPAVAELAVVGVPDPRLGERLVALVVPRGSFDSEEFLAWATERVAPYRRPRAAVTVAILPVGNNGKLDRGAAGRLARKLLEAGSTRQPAPAG